MFKKKFCIQILSLFLALAMLATSTFAQINATAQAKNESSLRVLVLDPTGAAVVAANVQLKTAGGEQTLQTNERGEAIFLRLPAGAYQLKVSADGFTAREFNNNSLKNGNNKFEVKLEIEGVKENVVVAQDQREKNLDPRGNAFSSVLTAEQIAQLPDDPEEFEQAIRAMGAPGSTLRVNGFRGGKLPPKSQIREIRFRMNPYSADSHEADFMSIDILTKPGINDWHGSVNFGFRDEALNARNAFAPVRGAEQLRRFGFSLDGPLWRNHTSLFLSAEGNSAYESKTIVAALPDGNFSDVIRRPSKTLNLSARIEQILTKTHTLRAEYQRNANRLDNLGVGDFDLLERAYTNDAAEHLLRFADTGTIGKRLVNEVRFQTRWQEIDKSSASNAPTVIVQNAFTSGGTQIQGARNIREIEFADNVDFVFGKHSMRAGVLYEFGSYRSDETQNANGTFVFSSLDAFRNNRPTTYTKRSGNPLVDYSQHEFGTYLQDDFKLSKSLSLSLGLRWESQNNLSDKNNFAPRFGIAWSPFKDGKTTIRGGAGIFYGWIQPDVTEQILRVDGERQRDLIVQNPGFPDPLASGTQITLPTSRIVRDPLIQMPYVRQFSIGVQRQLNGLGQMFVNYFNQRGIHQLRGHDINAPFNGVRPNPAFGKITQVESTANSSMQGLSINLNIARPQQRLFTAFNYFWSKSRNEADSAFSLPSNNFDLRADRGPSPGDVRHRFFAMVNYQLPLNLRVGTVFQANSATPYNITTGFDDNGDTVSNDRPVGVGRNSARGAGRWDLGTRLSWAFGFGKPKESAGGAGPQVRVIRAGGDNDMLGSMPSMSAANKRWRGELYLQAYNIFNHANKTGFSGVQTSPFFGQATSALAGRRIETGMRFSF
jgi:hypothetical protein